MKKPKPIIVRTSSGWTTISIVGFRDKQSSPYLSVDNSRGVLGYVEDRDVKRLRAWCDDCLKKRKS